MNLINMIQKVVGLIEKVGSEEEKKIAKELVEKVIPTPTKYENIFYVNGKETFYKVSNKEIYSTTCKEKKQDKYIGCAIVSGCAYYGSKNKFNKHLKEFYGSDGKDTEKYALIDAYARFGGKPNFEKYVDDRFRPKTKTK